MITKKEGWDYISLNIILAVSLLFFGIYISYEDDYKAYKESQKAQWKEKTKNWKAGDWQNYESQIIDEDYQCRSYCID